MTTSLGRATGRADTRPDLSPAYRAYLASPAWAELRRLVLLRDGHACTRCGRTDGLEVHHLTYARFGHEPLSDLVTVCRRHHEALDHERRRSGGEERRRRRATARRAVR